MHAGRQDVALLRRVWSTDITNLFDTQLAAGFAGLRAQLGYEALLHELLGVRLREERELHALGRAAAERRAGRLRPRRRPAPPPGSPTRCRTRLATRGRLDWAREECRALADATDERDPDVDLRAACRA